MTQTCVEKNGKSFGQVNEKLGFQSTITDIVSHAAFIHAPNAEGPVTMKRIMIEKLPWEPGVLRQVITPIEGVSINPGQIVNLTLKTPDNDEPTLFRVVHDPLPDAPQTQTDEMTITIDL